MSRFDFDSARGMYLPRERRIKARGLHATCGPAFFGSSASPAAWRTIYDWTALSSGNNSGWAGYTTRQMITAAALGGSGTKVRVTVQAGGTGGTMSKFYVQEAASSGSPHDFASTPVAVTWNGGSTSVVIGNTAPQMSDDITLSFSGAVGLVFSAYLPSFGNFYVDVAATNRAYSTEAYLFGDSAATLVPGAMTTSQFAMITKLELYG